MQLEKELYLAGPESILSVLQGTPGDFYDVILVGHNPGISMLAGLLNSPAQTIELDVQRSVAGFELWPMPAPGHLRLQNTLAVSRKTSRSDQRRGMNRIVKMLA